LCGAGPSSWKENFFQVDIIVEHSGASAIIDLWTTLNQGAGDESWGFSDFKLSYLDSDRKCSASSHSYAAPECAVLEDFIQNTPMEQGLWTTDHAWRTEECDGR
jgi:hypothetical protein